MAQPGSDMQLARRGVALHVPFAARACWRRRGLADAGSIAEPMVNSANLVVCGSQAVEYSPQAAGMRVFCAVSRA